MPYKTVKVDSTINLGALDQGRMIIEEVFIDDIVVEKDFPVEPDLVQRYTVMARENGFIPALLLRLNPNGTLSVIDGYHRCAVAAALGLRRIEAQIVECSDQQFWDMRIGSAISHYVISDDRLHLWMLEAWNVSPWAKRNDQQLVKAAYQVYTGRDPRKPKGQGGSPDTADLFAWFDERAKMWGRSAGQVAKIVIEKSGLARKFETSILNVATRRGLDFEGFAQTSAAFSVLRREPPEKTVNRFIDEKIDRKPTRQQVESVRSQAAQTPMGQQRIQHHQATSDALAKLGYLQAARYRIEDIVNLTVDLQSMIEQNEPVKRQIVEFFQAVEELAQRLGFPNDWNNAGLTSKRSVLPNDGKGQSGAVQLSPSHLALSSTEIEHMS